MIIHEIEENELCHEKIKVPLAYLDLLLYLALTHTYTHTHTQAIYAYTDILEANMNIKYYIKIA